MTGLEQQIALLFISAVLGFFLKYVWDRWLAQSSRVTQRVFDSGIKSIRDECTLKREGCFLERKANREYFESLLKQQSDYIEETSENDEVIEKRHVQTKHVLLCILVTQLKICDALNKSGVLGPGHPMDCDEISRMMIEFGVIE